MYNNIYELRYKVFTLCDIEQNKALVRIASVIDHVLVKNSDWLAYHTDNFQKGYTFSSFFPLAKDGKYYKNQVYQVTIRTVNEKLAEYLLKELPRHSDVFLKGLICDIKQIHKRHISSLYSITPLIVKGESGYWKDEMSFEKFNEQLKVNLIKKYNILTGEKLNEDFILFNYVERKNKMPIKIEYKNIYMLGDKIQAYVSENFEAQELAFLALGTGIGSMNQRGMGYVNVKFD